MRARGDKALPRTALRWSCVFFLLFAIACGRTERPRERERDRDAAEAPAEPEQEVIDAAEDEAAEEPRELSEELFTDYAAAAESTDYELSADHWLRILDLGEERELRYLRLSWDRSVCGAIRSYRIEGYQGEGDPRAAEYAEGRMPRDGFYDIYGASSAPYPTEEEIHMDGSVRTRYLRIQVEGAATAPVLGAYAQDPWAEVFDSIEPVIEDGQLVWRGLPAWLTLERIGSTPAAVLDDDGRAAELLQDKDAAVGCTLSYQGWSADSPDYRLELRIAEGEREEKTVNPCPSIVPQPQEWAGGSGMLQLYAGADIYTIEGYREIAELLAGEMERLSGRRSEVKLGSDAPGGTIVLRGSGEQTLGDEGYRLRIGDTLEISAYRERGLLWGTRTLLQLLAEAERERDSYLLPIGELRDYPSYPVRGFEIDVARNSVSLPTLRRMVDTLSWYKCNELTVHLNDNALLAYSDKNGSLDTVYGAYSAFRLETGIWGGSLTARDMSYTQEEFRELVSYAARRGVSVIPEIDTPAHSLAITSLYRSNGLRYTPEAADMLDLSKPDTLEIVKSIWDAALPAFEGCTALHLGGDEYYGDTDDYIAYENRLLEYLAPQAQTLRLWGSLTGKRGAGYVEPGEATELLIWNTDWAEPEVMYREGFGIINANHNELYLIPGGGYDHLSAEAFYTEFQVNRFVYEDRTSVELPSWLPKLRGAQLCMWNDLCDNMDIGISEYDMYVRLAEALPLFAQKCWNAGGDMSLAQLQRAIPYIDDGQANLPTEERLLEPDYEIILEVEWTGEKREIIGGEVQREGNSYIFYLRNADGNVGFSREGRSYDLGYALPAGETVRLTFEGREDSVTLYVNGEEVAQVGSSQPFEEHATFLFPIGSLRAHQAADDIEGIAQLQVEVK